MKELKLSLSANAGLSLSMPDGIMWIDAIHDKKTLKFSTVTKDIWEYMKQDPDFIGEDLKGPDIIAFTHCHTDHFSSKMCREAKSLYKRSMLILPQNYFREQKLLCKDTETVMLKNTRIEFIKARHSGAERGHKNYFTAIDDGKTKILLSGDTSLSEPLFHEFAESFHADTAVVNYIWLLFSKGRCVIDEKIRPKHLIITHLPFEDEDKEGLIDTVKKGAGLIKSTDDIRILCRKKQKECLA